MDRPEFNKLVADMNQLAKQIEFGTRDFGRRNGTAREAYDSISGFAADGLWEHAVRLHKLAVRLRQGDALKVTRSV